MLNFTKKIGMTFAKNRTYGVPEFAGTEVNRRSGNLKGLTGYLQTFHKKYPHLRTASPAGISTTRWSEHKQPWHDGHGHIPSCTYIITSTSHRGREELPRVGKGGSGPRSAWWRCSSWRCNKLTKPWFSIYHTHLANFLVAVAKITSSTP